MQTSLPSPSRQRIALAIGARGDDEQQLREGAKVLLRPFKLLLAEPEEVFETLQQLDPDDSPDLILFYLRENGPDPAWVHRIRSEIRQRRTPLLALMEADSEVDLTAYYLEGCNCCIKLQGGPAERQRLIQGMFRFWLGCVVLPARAQEAI